MVTSRTGSKRTCQTIVALLSHRAGCNRPGRSLASFSLIIECARPSVYQLPPYWRWRRPVSAHVPAVSLTLTPLPVPVVLATDVDLIRFGIINHVPEVSLFLLSIIGP